jgi:hypothetical protein
MVTPDQEICFVTSDIISSLFNLDCDIIHMPRRLPKVGLPQVTCLNHKVAGQSIRDEDLLIRNQPIPIPLF